ncbi:AT-rich interactive domain-containing protein 4A-like isoform X2 [Ornithodoros turicata]|uniref:AT-rich interactive domain-containing protein 4A-like isoform X2 n=1 Tax=Ornithodoros turicata TaxID=34597 RepID=UPI0031392E7E
MASAEEPLYLTVGTDVSAKYRGAFCEAKIKKVQRMVKCRVTFKNNQGTHLVPDDHIRGDLKIGAHVEAKHPDKSQFLEAVIGKLLDYSQYTVVFDDGDETTLRRTSLCLKSGRHFAESETLDQLPLTNPEHFGTPVMGSKAKRKRRSAAAASLPLEEDSSEEESAPPQRGRGGSSSWPLATVGRVVCLEGDRRKKDSWLPALVVSPGQEGILTNRDECLVRSFRDGKYYQVPKRHLRQYSRDSVPQRVENSTQKVALERAQTYLEKGELPAHWDAQMLLRGDVTVKDEDDDDDEDGADDVSDDEPSEEKDRFVAQLYKFMDERGTPINKGPAINGQDLNLYRLFRLVGQLGGGNRVSNQSQWRRVYTRLGLPPPANQGNAHLLRNSYKKYLQSFEDFYRKLGCTMESHPRGGISCRGSGRSPRHHRVLTRNQDRGLALFAPPPAKERKEVVVKEEESTPTAKEETGRGSLRAADDTKARRTREKNSSDSGSGTTTRRSSSEPSSGAPGGTQQPDNSTERPRGSARRDTPPPTTTNKRNWRKKLDESIERVDEDSSGGGSSSTAGGADGSSEGESLPPRSRGPLEVAIGDRVRVKYGRGRQLKVYEAKVLRIEDDGPDRRFYVHYTGWNMRYDEWVRKNRIVENVTDKAGRRKRIHKDVPDTPPGSNKRAVASRGGVRRGRPPGSVRGGVHPRPTSASSTRGRRRSGALGYESGGNSDESSQQAAATPQEEELLKTAKEEPEEDIDDRESGASSLCSTDQADARDQTSPLPDMVQEERDTKEEEKEKEEEDEDTDIDEDASGQARPRSADGEEDSRADEETRGDEQEVEGDRTMEEEKEEEDDSLSGNLLIYEESSTAEELDVEKDEAQGVTVEEPPAEAPVPTVEQSKEETIIETPSAEEETKGDDEEQSKSPSVVEAGAQNDEAVDGISLQASATEELETTDFLHESEVKDEPLICEEVIQESNSEVEMECKLEDAKDEVEEEEEERKTEQGEAVTAKEEEAVPELEPPVEVKHEEVATEPIIEEPLYEETDEIIEMEGEPMTKTVQELVESALEALETTEADDIETAPHCEDVTTSVEVKKEEAVTVKTEEANEEEGETPTPKVKKKKGPRMKKSKLEVAGQKRLKKRSRKLHSTVERRQLAGAQVGQFSKRRKMGMRGCRREDAAGSSREAVEAVAEPDDFLSTLAEVCSGQGSSLKEQPVAAESADALFLLCEEKVPASPLHSAADLSVPVLENTPPTTPDDSEGTSSEAASPHRSGCGHTGGGSAPGVASFLDAESTLSAEGDSENSQGLADLKGEGEDSSSSRTTDSAEALKAGVKRTASGAALPDLDEMAAVQTDGVSTSPVQAAIAGPKRARKSTAPRTPTRCEPSMKARQPRSVLKARDMFLGSSLENTEMGLRRPSKFHFDAPLDEDMEPEQRINVLQDRMAELRKVYTALKAEVALIDRRRKRAKKKDSGTPGAPDSCSTPEAHCFS